MSTKLKIGALEFETNLIQGPLAGVSCAPFRELFNLYQKPAYCVSEMLSAQDVISKHHPQGRYLYKSPHEGILAYQLSGNHPNIMSQAAMSLEQIGADIIDINCGCPKPKIRKKGAGSALLENTDLLLQIVTTIKKHIAIPLTVKIRLQSLPESTLLTQSLEQAGADAITIHGRTPQQEYDVPCEYDLIKKIKQTLSIPVITNGDIKDKISLEHAKQSSLGDAYMISRAGCGKPWLYQELLSPTYLAPSIEKRIELFMLHLEKLSTLETEFKALLQARTLMRFYFKEFRESLIFEELFQSTSIKELNIRLTYQLESL